MKLKYFIPSLVAVVAAMFTGCSDDNTPTLLSEVQVSSSYVTINENGGSTTIGVKAIDSWSIDATTIPAWLTISPASGSAGESQVTFTAGSTKDKRTVELLLNCGNKSQRLIVSQGEESTEVLTVAQALAMIKADQTLEKSVIVKGVVCKIQEISPSYGNATFFISDDGTYSGSYGADGQGDGNWLEIYRGAWLNGEKFTKGDEFEVGDELTIKGILMSYKGTPETKEKTASVLSQVKSLIKCDSLMINNETVTDATLPVEGGEITACLTCKGNGVAVEVPADAKDWLGVTSSTVGTNPTITFYAKANEGGDRETTVTFKTTDGSKEYTAQTTIAQKGAIVECSVADFLAAPVGNAQYRITGVIQSVAKAEYGNIYVRDFSGEAYVYGVGSKGDFEKLGLKVGDIVTLVGKRGEYKGSAQMTGAQYETHIPVTPVTIEEFLQKPDDKNTYYMVTGTISSLKGSNGKDTDYGNLYITDGTNELYVYGCYSGWGATGDARKYFIADNDIKVGDELTMIGYKDTYKELVELCGGINFSFKHANAE